MAILTPPASAEQRFLLAGLDYQKYVALADLLGEQPVRLTYDRGRLELMTTSREHERYKHLLGLLVMIIAVEMGIDTAGGGSMTFRREELDRGLEPDECYWIEHEAAVRGRDDYNPETDPPPDLVLEIEVSRSVLDRLAIFAAMGVPEVWRFDGQSIVVLLLGSDAEYRASAQSRAFPFLPVADLVRFIGLRATMSDTAIARAFQDWVREQKARGWPAAGGSPQGEE
jgi:Uma2 family endonuclease